MVFRCARTMRSAMNAARLAGARRRARCRAASRRASSGAPCRLVPLRDARVEIPAVVIEPRRSAIRLASSSVSCLELLEADDHVRDLHAGVVDVVLHFDRVAAEAQHAHQRVAERGVAQVADVRRLVRVDRGVLDDGLLRPRRRRRQRIQPGRAAAAGTPGDRGTRSGSRWARPRRAATPGIGPSAPASSCAIARGALRSRRARSKATGVPRSPSVRLGGYSIGIVEVGVGRCRAAGRVVAHTRLDLFVQRQNHVAGSLTRSKACGTLTLSDPHAFVMVDAGIGRLLIASLHQGIADVSPTRLEFYENWLSPTGMRDGRIGLAPLGAVLSFLQREEPPANDADRRARRHAAPPTGPTRTLSALRRWYIGGCRRSCARARRSAWASASSRHRSADRR